MPWATPAPTAPSVRTSTRSKPSFATVRAQIEQGGGGMPSFADDLTGQQIADVAAYVAWVKSDRENRQVANAPLTAACADS
jgi:mono/diheme cytochrome c family protein